MQSDDENNIKSACSVTWYGLNDIYNSVIYFVFNTWSTNTSLLHDLHDEGILKTSNDYNIVVK